MSTPRFGVWAPVYGNHGARNHPHDPPDAGYLRTRDLLRRAERLGYDATLVAQHVIHPSNTADDVLEAWSTLAALAEATERIELIGAIKPLLMNPLLFAKFSTNVGAISGGRLAVNVVSGWFLPELEALGVAVPDHDDRYRYTGDWLEAVLALWDGQRVDIAGRGGHPALIHPTPTPRPTVYFGGESEPARALAARSADVFFVNGRPLNQTVELIGDLRSRPRLKSPLRFGLSAFVITRDTEAEAIAELDHLQQLVDAEQRPEIASGADPATQMYKVLSGVRRVGSNGGTLAGLVGSHEQVIERIEAFHRAGVDLFMLQFQPLDAELERFARNVIPHFTTNPHSSGQGTIPHDSPYDTAPDGAAAALR
ncbi:LLM class flavin-dependent oxidoreductase [Mycobacterium sp. 852013-51886_SCH5428379]|uniref:LLM class flavin-dependent oxidoreductase n=1 Tax=Mycobacterium sp. 852013-51886_SCH5428379 TaxID=1834111 RepID=UPI0009EEB5A9|nr:LLM class flavin-dependent oxidoreductase [Mycobacterium sp. 852013-51886_SCH5428379]